MVVSIRNQSPAGRRVRPKGSPGQPGATGSRYGGSRRPAARGHELPGAADRAAQLPAPAAALTLPTLAGIPGRFVVTAREEELAFIADELLAARVLRSSDWAGRLRASITGGLGRWSGEVIRAATGSPDLVLVDATLLYTGDILDNWFEPYTYECFDPAAWEPYPGGTEEPYGGFGMMSGQNGNYCVEVRPAMERLLERAPGAAWPVYHVLQRAMVEACQAWTPAWAACVVEEWDYYRYEDDSEAEEGAEDNLTTELLRKYLPAEALKVSVGRLPVRALRRARAGLEEGALARVLDGAIAVAGTLSRWYRADANDLLSTELLTIPALWMRWDDKDPIDRVADERADYVNQGGEDATDLFYLTAWQPGMGRRGRGSLVDAIRRIAHHLTLLGQLDQLIQAVEGYGEECLLRKVLA